MFLSVFLLRTYPAPLGAGLAAAAAVAHTVGHHCSPSVRSVVPVLSLGDGACSFITGICRCAEGKEERRGYPVRKSDLYASCPVAFPSRSGSGCTCTLFHAPSWPVPGLAWTWDQCCSFLSLIMILMDWKEQ